MRNTIAYLTQKLSSPSRGIPCSHKQGNWRPSHSGLTVSSGMEEMPPLNMPVQRLKVAILPLDLPCSGPVTHSGEILTTGKSHGKKPGRLSLNDVINILKHLLQFKAVLCNDKSTHLPTISGYLFLTLSYTKLLWSWWTREEISIWTSLWPPSANLYWILRDSFRKWV